MNRLKHLVKKYLWKQVFHHRIYGNAIKQNKDFISGLDETGTFSKKRLDIFTTAGEDGILLEIFSNTGIVNKRFVDIGSNDCINSNCANLAFHHGWSGVFIDGNNDLLERGKYIYSQHLGNAVSRFSFVHAIVTVNNINKILSNSLNREEADLLSIDLDGNDYFIWEKITVINPRVVVAEVQVEKGNTDFIPSYNNEFELYETNTPKGASPLSMTKLAEAKGYKLVAANKGCYNLFFVRKDCMNNLKELSVEDVLKENA